MIQSVRNRPTSHRRYRESDILSRINGGNETRTVTPPEKHSKNDERGGFFDDIFDEYSETASSNPDDKYTSWERETSTAKAELEIERINQEKLQLQREREWAEQEAARRAATQEQRQKAREWLKTAKDNAILMKNTGYLIPGSRETKYPPSSVLAKMAKRLDRVVTLSTCPMPESPTDQYSGVYAYDFACKSAKEVIDEWLESERRKWEAQNRHDSFSPSSELYEDWSVDTPDEEPDEDDEEWDDYCADDDDSDDEDWEDYYG